MTTPDHQGDEITATGRHRAWTGESPAPWCVPGLLAIRSATGSTVACTDADTSLNSRHAAITRSLHTWSNYKSWTDKVRSNWDKDKSGK